MTALRIQRADDPEEKLVDRSGCTVTGEVCEIFPRQVVQKVAEFRISAGDFISHILGLEVDPEETTLLIEDVCALPRTVVFDPRAVKNKIFDCGSIKIVGTVTITDSTGYVLQHTFHIRAAFQEIEPITGIRPTDQVLEQLESVEGTDVCTAWMTDPSTGLEIQLLIFKAALAVEKRIFRCVIDGIPACD